ncbi:LysM peptidoglycan-binding domain-containing protein [Halomonas sp. hl-4]|uniref:LysM peptidoglycan-binding domain-containing protein n=1 Tax=Halomonas sp. hl-4 TaxID=1761789 RepID=UPI000BB97C05|nr:LysM domain-containing protein [Halomonas sp. hl-4]SNY97222.1 LysM domain-containing protein [Halomonas sp. hl-4]
MGARQHRHRAVVGGWLIGVMCLLITLDASAWERVRDSAPERYTVVTGDTLWDLAGRFLHAPWHWPELWQTNPDIDNPHLIYPGDVITLSDCQGAPCLSLSREQQVVKLSPQMRTVPRREAISPIDASVIQPFLRDHRIVNGDPADGALAYVVAGNQGRLISGAGDSLYVRGQVPTQTNLGIYRPAEAYVADDGTALGTELIKIGEARYVRAEEDIAQLEVLSAHQEVRNNDLVLPLETPRLSDEMVPRAPRNELSGALIGVPGGVRFIGRLQVVTIDLGTLDGVQAGHVFQIAQQGEVVSDPRSQAPLTLPSEVAGTLMVFKPYDRVSYALVMEASTVLEVGDQVRTPPR